MDLPGSFGAGFGERFDETAAVQVTTASSCRAAAPPIRHSLRVMAVIDQRVVVERILRHLGLWSGGQTLGPARAPPEASTGPWAREPCADVDTMPDYENVLTDGGRNPRHNAIFRRPCRRGVPAPGAKRPPFHPSATIGGGLRAVKTPPHRAKRRKS